MRTICLSVFLLLLALPNPVAAAETSTDYYAVLLEGQPAGWMSTTVTKADGRISTESATKITLKRGTFVIEIGIGSTFVETDEGKPIEATSTMAMARSQTVKRYAFHDDHVAMTVEQAGAKRTTKQPLPEGEWLTPAAAERSFAKQLEAGKDRIVIRSIDASVGLDPVEVTWQRKGEATVDVLGKAAPAIHWTQIASIMPSVSSDVYTDASGAMLRSTVNMGPGLSMVMVKADADIARAKVDPPELLASTLIKPDKRIDNPRAARSAVYELKFKAGDGKAKAPTLPRAGYQRVVWVDEGTAKVVVDLSRPVNPDKDLPTRADRSASSTIDTEDKAIKAFAAKVLGELAANTDRKQMAALHCAAVAEHIDEKDLSVGFATASEVVRTKQGDCSEHAVLLAALLRSADIPARTVSGLVYVERFVGRRDVFGYHMWTQAWLDIDGKGARWVDLDATLPAGRTFDATHIALAVSSMSDDNALNDMIQIAPMIGAIQLQVGEVESE